jgi:hypothetical protein
MRRHVSHALRLGLVLAIVAMGPVPAIDAQQGARLSRIIGAFLVDSGVQTRGLPWTTGNALPIRWRTAAPARNTDQYSIQRGMTHTRIGTVRAIVSDSVTLPMTISVSGTATGLAMVAFSFDSLWVTLRDGSGILVHRGMIEDGLRHDGVALTPIKCSRTTEGASYGNVIDAVKLPGKTASGLWWFWQSPQQEPELLLTLLYRRADMAQVECYSG